ncbi:GNAT family N-acetyltransferase [Paenibacillus sp. UNC499MF]|uniref:GNAT family N-acetyltransferase n=1 Tax=Paenibacillus sp. UNC499MF TaxID=1502751 RepID=UPI0008A082DE|nr:GNAT family N-acetyltransferase [Paenibacillus sp. UNC499MF]SEG57426.1 Acetyltransferase (GNAT) domain-containing protein [Paenibacillus sp. UNC499MF]
MNVRLVKPDEMTGAAALADSIFRDGEQVSMAAGFPYLFSAVTSYSFGAYGEDGRMTAFMGLLPSAVRIGAARLNVFSVGAVCTAPEARGHGVAGKLLDAVKEQVAAADGDLILVSGTRSLYTRAGCRTFGTIRRYTLTPEMAPALREAASGAAAAAQAGAGAADTAAPPASQAGASGGAAAAEPFLCREWTRSDLPALAKLAASREVAFEQSQWDLAMLIDAQAYARCVKLGHRVYVAERRGVPAAFLVAALPGSLRPKMTPFAIEWAGETPAVAALLAHALETAAPEKLDVLASRHDARLAALLQEHAPFADEQILGTVYVPDAARLFRRLKPYLAGLQPEKAAGLEGSPGAADRGIRLSYPGLDDLELDADAWIALLFDGAFVMPEEAADSAAAPVLPEGTPAQWRETLTGLFPVPFPSTSGLNYI